MIEKDPGSQEKTRQEVDGDTRVKRILAIAEGTCSCRKNHPE
jgi:hypothetical protein